MSEQMNGAEQGYLLGLSRVPSLNAWTKKLLLGLPGCCKNFLPDNREGKEPRGFWGYGFFFSSSSPLFFFFFLYFYFYFFLFEDVCYKNLVTSNRPSAWSIEKFS